MTPPAIPSSGTWRGRFIGAMGFIRTVYLSLDFKDTSVTGSYFTYLRKNGLRVEGAITGTYTDGVLRLEAAGPLDNGKTMENFDLELTYVEGGTGRAEAAYGVVRGRATSAPYSGVIRLRRVAPMSSVETNGWIDESLDEI